MFLEWQDEDLLDLNLFYGQKLCWKDCCLKLDKLLGCVAVWRRSCSFFHGKVKYFWHGLRSGGIAGLWIWNFELFSLEMCNLGLVDRFRKNFINFFNKILFFRPLIKHQLYQKFHKNYSNCFKILVIFHKFKFYFLE